MKIGVQLFTVRKQANKNLFLTLKELSEMGIKYVEAARIPFDANTADTFVNAEEAFGTKVVSTQIKMCKLEEEYDKIVSFHKKVGCSSAIISVLPTQYIVGEDHMLNVFCRKASELAKRYAGDGIQLSYHHHDFEFIKSGNITRYDILTDNLTGVKLVLDTYWLTKAGKSVPNVIKKYSGRIEGLHLRDYALVRKLISRTPKDYAVGEGVIDFAEIIECAKLNGVKYGAIEQNTKKPFEELQKSISNLKKLGYKDMFNR
ncbi:MAG: sugar phosphate isomerase/epimerase [Clostridia bacterium]|nr:sugar phosphate isomerase/epimerase [Clostridia bacterium]